MTTILGTYDVLIVGGGAAGLTAAIYTCRKGLKTLVVSVDIGGQTNLTNHIENYPGVDPMPGPQLMQKFQDNAISFGAEVTIAKITKIEKKEEKGSMVFACHTMNGTYEARSVILAFGRVHKSLNIPGEEEFLGKGLCTCTTCDAPLYRNKTVAVIGGGNSAVEAAIELARIATNVYIVHRREQFKADALTVEKLKNHKNIELVMDTIPTKVEGQRFVTGLEVEDNKTKQRRTIALDGVFIEIGYELDTSMVKGLVKLNERNEIIVDADCATSCPGIFAAGDVTTVQYKQTVISAGEGAKAALEAHKYLTGGKAVVSDWG